MHSFSLAVTTFAPSARGGCFLTKGSKTAHFSSAAESDYQVPRWAASGLKCIFEDEQTATIVWDHLEGNRADPQSPMLTKSVFARRTQCVGGRLAEEATDFVIAHSFTDVRAEQLSATQ